MPNHINTPGAETMALPETERTAPGQNGLYRINYFNGRMLTADALRKEQVYWDYRARLLGEIHPAGIAWGLGLSFDDPPPWAESFEPAPHVEGLGHGIRPGTQITLRPGLAFNGIGQPIVVGADFRFKLADLLDQFRSNQTVVIDGGTAFAPCVCLAPMPAGGMPGGQALPEGPYLLLIDPRESLEGEAKVYQTPCPGKNTPHCEKDGIRGGFVLSLARFPVEVPMDQISSEWDLRSILSAYYFDVYERSLIERWHRPFPLGAGNEDFCNGPGPFDRQAGHVPLAMIYVASGGTVLFLDPWIPRRSIASTASLGWSANLRGAPTAAACVARVHQFQCQLRDRLALQEEPTWGGHGHLIPEAEKKRRGMPGAPASASSVSESSITSLYDLGFRWIPPFGFLPIPEIPTKADAGTKPGAIGTAAGPGLFTGGMLGANQQVRAALQIARKYFQHTNVMTFAAVALHDDDILEDMIRAMEKDPIALRYCEDSGADGKLYKAPRTVPPAQPVDPTPSPRPGPAPVDPPHGPIAAPFIPSPERPAGSLPLDREKFLRAVGGPRTPLRHQAHQQQQQNAPTGIASNEASVTPARAITLAFLRPLLKILGKCDGVTVEKLINREIEVVKLILPMEGLRREYPVLGQVKIDASAAPYGVWSWLSRNAAAGSHGSRYGKTVDTLFGDVLDLAARPHGFVFYVKQRMVWLEAIYQAVDIVLDLLALVQIALGGKLGGSDDVIVDPEFESGSMFSVMRRAGFESAFLGAMRNSLVPYRRRDPRFATFDVGLLRQVNASQPVRLTEGLRLVLADDVTRSAALTALFLWAPELALPGTWRAYRRVRDAEIASLTEARPRDPAVALEARGRAIDVMLREHKGFAALKIAAVALPEAELLGIEEMLESEAKVRGARSEATLVQETFYREGHVVSKDETADLVFATSRKAYGERSIHDVAPDLPGLPGVHVEDTLAGTRKGLNQLVGGRAAEKLSRKIRTDADTIRKAAVSLAGSGVLRNGAFWRIYDEALAKSEGDTPKALAALSEVESYKQPAAELAKLHGVLGEKGFDEVVAAARAKA